MQRDGNSAAITVSHRPLPFGAAPSPSLIARRALLAERRNAFVRILARARLALQIGLERKLRLQIVASR